MDGEAAGRPPGVEFHTFTVVGRCRRTGRLGVGTATRSLAVGARVPHVRAGLGAVAIMAIADARLGQMALRLLELGYKAPAVVEELVRTRSTASSGSSTATASRPPAPGARTASGPASGCATTTSCSATT
jgi:hypothetical protein